MPASVRLLLIFGAAASVSGTTTLVATDPNLKWQGRVQRRDDVGVVAFDSEGARVDFVVSGATSVSVRVTSTFLSAPRGIADSEGDVNAALRAYSGYAAAAEGVVAPARAFPRVLQDGTFPKFGVFRAMVDGARVFEGQDGVVVLPGASVLYPVIGGLDSSSSHNVSVWYTTDAVYNTWPDVNCPGCEMRVEAVQTDGTITPAATRTRRALIIGDSITAANQVTKPCSNASDNDHSRSYASLICEHFEVNCTTIAVSSKGLHDNCCDSLPTTVPDFAQRVFMQDPTSVFDWASEPPPHFVLINLGTNDAGHDNGPAWETSFVGKYVAFMRNITRWTSKPDIVFL
jgi:hypothetical protein